MKPLIPRYLAPRDRGPRGAADRHEALRMKFFWLCGILFLQEMHAFDLS